MHLDRLRFLGIAGQIQFTPLELLEFTNIYNTIDRIQSDEIYNLGAQSFVGGSFEIPMSLESDHCDCWKPRVE